MDAKTKDEMDRASDEPVILLCVYFLHLNYRI